MKRLLRTPPDGRWIITVTAVFLVGVLSGRPAGAQLGKVQAELSCRLVPYAGESGHKNWLVELQNSGGEVVRRSTGASGSTVHFKKLVPAIYLVCVSGEKGRSRCESVDLFLAKGEQAHRFAKDFALPNSVLNAPGAYKISSVRLAVPPGAQREMARSQECRLQGHTTEAILHLERALTICPKYPEALNNLGTYYHRSGNYDKAIQCFRKVTEIDPDFYVGWLNLGGSLFAKGSVDQALDAQLRALALRPDDITANALAAMTYFRLRRLPEARERFLRVAEADPASASLPHFYLALISMVQNRTAEADEYIRSYLEIHPNSPRSPYLRRTLDNLASSAMSGRAATLRDQSQERR